MPVFTLRYKLKTINHELYAPNSPSIIVRNCFVTSFLAVTGGIGFVITNLPKVGVAIAFTCIHMNYVFNYYCASIEWQSITYIPTQKYIVKNIVISDG